MAAPPVRPSRRPGLLGYFVRHGTAANLLMALMMLFGLYGAQNLNLQLTPDIASNQVAVNVVWEGAGPEQVDGAIIARLQPPLQDIDGVERIRSSARDGSGAIRDTALQNGCAKVPWFPHGGAVGIKVCPRP